MEHVSRDCFKDGSALAEVMSLYENISQDNLADHHNPDTGFIEQKTDHLAIKVQVIMDFSPNGIEVLTMYLNKNCIFCFLWGCYRILL